MDIGNRVEQFQQHQLNRQIQPDTMGSFGGKTITMNDPTSLIMNSAEEASFAMSEREEARLEERKMKRKGPGTDQLEMVKKYTELMEKQEKKILLDSFLSSLSQQKDLDPRSAGQEAQKFFKDIADAYAALEYARQELGERFGDNLFLEAMDLLEDLAGREIKARLAAGIASLDHEALGDAQGLKDLYSDTISDLGSPLDIYERVVKDYGENRFEEALDFLRHSLGNDIAATSASTEKTQLEGIVRDLGTVQLLHGLNEQCKTLNARVEKLHGKSGMTNTELVRDVLKLRDAHFVGPFDIEGIADKIGMQKIEDRIVFFQDFSASAREFSENLFSEPENRLNIIEAIQTALDDAIAVEDEMYGDD